MPRPLPLRPALLCICLLGAGPTPGARGEEEPPRVELPTYVVETTRLLPPPEDWRYARLPHFEVLSDESDRKTQEIVRELARLDAALEVVWPAIFGRNTDTNYLLICRDRGVFVRFAPSSLTTHAGLGSLLLPGEGANALLLSANTVLNLEAFDLASQKLAGSNVAVTGIQVDPIKQLYREYVHFLLRKKRPRLPAWFEEGLTQIVMSMRISSDSIELGKLEDPNTLSFEQRMALEIGSPVVTAEEREFQSALSAPVATSDGTLSATLGRKSLIDFARFFAVASDSSLARNSVGNFWAKQCHAFVHLCLFGENRKYLSPCLRYLALTAGRPPTEAAFQEAFGLSYAEMAAILDGYIQFASFQWQRWSLKPGAQGLAEPAPALLRDATQGEVGRIKGETFLLAAKLDDAREEFVTAYRRGERDPRLLAALGAFEYRHGDRARAAKFLQAAVRAQVPIPGPYLDLARLRGEETAPVAGAASSPVPAAAPPVGLTAAQAAAIAEPLRQAPRLSSPPPELFELLAQAWMRCAEPPPRADATLLVQGAAAYPTRWRLIYETATLCARAQLWREAQALADHGQRLAPTPTDRQRFAQLKATLPAPAPTAP